MGMWPRFLFLLVLNNLAWCCMEAGFPPCVPGPPAHLASSLSSRHPEEDGALRKMVPTAAAGKGLWSKTQRQRSFPVPFLKQGSWGALYLSPQYA